jgi:peptide deformylase
VDTQVLYRRLRALHIRGMAILKIARMGHPVLRQVASPIEDPGAPEIRRLVADMLETMRDAEGTGLAAPQVYVPKRLVIFSVSAEREATEEEDDADAADDADDADADAEDEDIEDVPLTVLINPVVEPLTEEMAVGWEACLSVPDLAGKVPRFAAVRYRGWGLDGTEIVREATGFHARVVQHECDHLDGILYPQRMRDMTTLMFTSEMRAQARAEAAE